MNDSGVNMLINMNISYVNLYKKLTANWSFEDYCSSDAQGTPGLYTFPGIARKYHQ